MADLVTGAMGSLVPKLGELLKDEYKLQAGVKERIRFLTQELEAAQAGLRKVAEVPWDQLDEEVKIWARHVREASYDMEDVLDSFLVRVQHGPDDDSTEQEESLLKQSLKKMANVFKKSKARRKISKDVDDIMAHLQEVTERCRRYKVHDIVSSRPSTASTIIDPRLHAMYNKVKDLVGIDKPSRELISMLQSPQRNDQVPNPQMKIVSIVGVGGLGKTTLARAVYDKLKFDYDWLLFLLAEIQTWALFRLRESEKTCNLNKTLKKVFTEILVDLDKKKYLEFSKAVLNERQLINELRSFLEKKRYFFVIDDIWDIQSWETIKLAFDAEKNRGGRVMITTRYMEIATIADQVYKLQTLPYDSSRGLLFTRIADSEAEYVHSQPDEICNKFIRKCGGIPLAIITMASLLAHKKREDWYKLYESISFGDKRNREAETTMTILSYSYYDLPSHLRTCLLYLSAFPEDSVIGKDSLVWKWVAEGFICKEKEKRLFETGEDYFNDLINRSMIEVVEAVDHRDYKSVVDDSIIYGCRVHDVVLDFIRDMSREENFFTLWDTNNDEGRLDQRNIRRLAHHNKTSRQANHTEMASVRSVIAFSCVTDTWVLICRFKLVRILDIELSNSDHDHSENLGQLLHLRFLRLSGTKIKKIPEEIGALKFLQTLDMGDVRTLGFPSRRCLPKQLACLRISIHPDALNADEFSVEGLTSLEELSIDTRYNSIAGRRLVKQLSSLTELRVLDASFDWDEEMESELVECLRHLIKLQHVQISCWSLFYGRKWQGSGFVFHRPLRHLVVDYVKLCKLPSCISPSRLPNLRHLDLFVEHVDGQDLKLLGKLPELYYLRLNHFNSVSEGTAAITNVSDSDAAGYFPKLRFCILKYAMVFFVGNKESKVISFHLWNGQGDIPLPCASGGDDELKSDDNSPGPMHSVVSDDQSASGGDDELQSGDELKSDDNSPGPMHSVVSDDQSASGGDDELQSGDELKSDDNSPGPMHSVVSDDQNKGSKNAAAPLPFMPRLQVLHFTLEDHCNFGNLFGNLGLEYLSSLREIQVKFFSPETPKRLRWYSFNDDNAVLAILRHAVEVHPNRPTLEIQRW